MLAVADADEAAHVRWFSTATVTHPHLPYSPHLPAPGEQSG